MSKRERERERERERGKGRKRERERKRERGTEIRIIFMIAILWRISEAIFFLSSVRMWKGKPLYI